MHAIFDEKMADSMARDVSAEGRRVLWAGLRRLDQFYGAALEDAWCPFV